MLNDEMLLSGIIEKSAVHKILIMSTEVYILIRNQYLSPSPPKMIFFLICDRSFFNSYCAFFTQIFLYFAIILPVYLQFSLSLSLFLPFSFPFLPFSRIFSPFSLSLFIFFPTNDIGWYFFLSWGGGGVFFQNTDPCANLIWKPTVLLQARSCLAWCWLRASCQMWRPGPAASGSACPSSPPGGYLANLLPLSFCSQLLLL